MVSTNMELNIQGFPPTTVKSYRRYRYSFLSDSKFHYMGDTEIKFQNLPLRYIGDKANSVQVLKINFFRVCRNGFVILLSLIWKHSIGCGFKFI